jgi:hypothetical protein
LHRSFPTEEIGSETNGAIMPVELRALQSLKLWHDVHLGLAHQGGDLSSGQISILLTIDLEPPPHTARSLARKLDVTKPVITRAWTPWARSTSHPESETRRTGATSSSNAPSLVL